MCSNMDGPRDDHTKWSKSDRKINITWYHLYMESKKNKLTDIKNKLMVTKEEGRNKLSMRLTDTY